MSDARAAGPGEPAGAGGGAPDADAATAFEVGIVGLGRMGGGIAERLLAAGHRCVVHDLAPDAVAALVAEGAVGADSLEQLVATLRPPRTVWVMVPAALVQDVLDGLGRLFDPDDVVVDGGNSYYRDDVARAAQLAEVGVHLLDCGTSGGVHGAQRGYCLMIGGDAQAVARLDPLWRTLAPGEAAAAPTPRRDRAGGTAQEGYLHCGPPGAGHFVKMVHNGIEYGMMAALAEGLSILEHADVGAEDRVPDAETAPLRDPQFLRYDLDLSEITELWRRGSVIDSWLLDLTADALAGSPDLSELTGRVSDSGEGRWTVMTAIEEGVPAPVITAALQQRFESRGKGAFTGKVLSAMRAAFGGHAERS